MEVILIEELSMFDFNVWMVTYEQNDEIHHQYHPNCKCDIIFPLLKHQIEGDTFWKTVITQSEV